MPLRLDDSGHVVLDDPEPESGELEVQSEESASGPAAGPASGPEHFRGRAGAPRPT